MKFKLGDKVKHEEYGEGFVINVDDGWCYPYYFRNNDSYEGWVKESSLTKVITPNDVIEAWEGSECIYSINFDECKKWTFATHDRTFGDVPTSDAYGILMGMQKSVKTEKELQIEELEKTVKEAKEKIDQASKQIEELKGDK